MKEVIKDIAKSTRSSGSIHKKTVFLVIHLIFTTSLPLLQRTCHINISNDQSKLPMLSSITTEQALLHRNHINRLSRNYNSYRHISVFGKVISVKTQRQMKGRKKKIQFKKLLD